MTISNPTPWETDGQYIYDANGEIVYLGERNNELVVVAVNAYVGAEIQLKIRDGELGDRWQSQRFDRHQCAMIDGEGFTITEWLDRIGAVEVQIVKGADSYIVFAKGTR